MYTDPSGEFFWIPTGIYFATQTAVSYLTAATIIATTITAGVKGAISNGGMYTANIATSNGGFSNWDWGQFGNSLAVDTLSGSVGAGAGMLTQSLQVYGAVPGALIEGTIQGTAGGLAGGFGNVIMEDDWGLSEAVLLRVLLPVLF